MKIFILLALASLVYSARDMQERRIIEAEPDRDNDGDHDLVVEGNNNGQDKHYYDIVDTTDTTADVEIVPLEGATTKRVLLMNKTKVEQEGPIATTIVTHKVTPITTTATITPETTTRIVTEKFAVETITPETTTSILFPNTTTAIITPKTTTGVVTKRFKVVNITPETTTMIVTPETTTGTIISIIDEEGEGSTTAVYTDESASTAVYTDENGSTIIASTESNSAISERAQSVSAILSLVLVFIFTKM